MCKAISRQTVKTILEAAYIDNQEPYPLKGDGLAKGGSMDERVVRELRASDEQDVYRNWGKLSKRFDHVFFGPNTSYYERIFDDLVRTGLESGGEKRVLEIGCGTGWYSDRIASFGAASVLGIDISPKRLEQARQKYERPGKSLKYALADVSEGLEGVFDVIVAKAILHHLDYQRLVPAVYGKNLRPGGLFLIWEPLGENLLIRAYHWLLPGVHTPDERSFTREDIHWFHTQFPDCQVLPVNYLSLPLGIISSLVFKHTDNRLLRMADRIDRFLARKATFLHTHFRNAIFVIRKPL